MGQPARLEKMTSVRGRGRPPRKNRASKAPTGPSSHKSDNEDHENLLVLNEPPARPLEASNPPPEAPADVARYTKKDLERIIQTVLQAQVPKDGARNKAFKARSPDVYGGRSHMECYNFCR